MAARPTIVMGDFNVKHWQWRSPVTNDRITAIWEGAMWTDLIINQRSAYTCVRWGGGSVIDIVLATLSVARRVKDWRIAEVETLRRIRCLRCKRRS